MRICPRCRSVYSAPVAFCGLDGEKIVESATDPLIGEVLDRYRIVQRIGEGGMGIVYRATHTVISREYAIKVLFGELASNSMFVERMRREAQAVSLMRHPNIVIVEDFGATPAGIHFLVMELVDGRTLHHAIKKEAPFSLIRAGAIARQIAAALGEAHRLGFVHRDLKPSNIMLTAVEGREHVKVLDFGVVTQEVRDDTQAPLTAAGAIIGTPMYMAPEQTDSHCTSSVDLYSLGVILYEMIAGRPPFTGTPKELLKKHLTDPVPPLGPCLGLEGIVGMLMEKSPDKRLGSADEVARLIDLIDFSLSPGPEVGSDATELSLPGTLELDTMLLTAAGDRTDPSSPPLSEDPVPFAFDVSDLALDETTSRAIAAIEQEKKIAPLLSRDHMPIERVRGQPATPAPSSPVSPAALARIAPHATAASKSSNVGREGVGSNVVRDALLGPASPAPSYGVPVSSPLSTLDVPQPSGPALETESSRPFRKIVVAVVLLAAAFAGGAAFRFLRRADQVELVGLRDVPRPDPKPVTATIAEVVPVQPRPPITVAPLAPDEDPQLSVLEVDLQQALSERGLTIADLEDLVATSVKRWKSAADKNEKLAATKQLIADVERAAITAPFLRQRLKKIGEQLKTTTGADRASRLKELNSRHAHITSLVRLGLAPEDYDGLSIMISILADDTRRLASE